MSNKHKPECISEWSKGCKADRPISIYVYPTTTIADIIKDK